MGGREEIILPQCSFKPLHLISYWKETFTTRQCISAVILLQSGIDEYKLQVIDDGTMLQLTVTWPTQMTDVRVLHHCWLNMNRSEYITEHHPKIGGFETALRRLRASVGEDIKSIANISLPCAVETTIDEEPLLWEDSGVRILYVDMKAAIDAYATSRPKKIFKSMSSTSPTIPGTRPSAASGTGSDPSPAYGISNATWQLIFLFQCHRVVNYHASHIFLIHVWTHELQLSLLAIYRIFYIK